MYEEPEGYDYYGEEEAPRNGARSHRRRVFIMIVVGLVVTSLLGMGLLWTNLDAGLSVADLPAPPSQDADQSMVFSVIAVSIGVLLATMAATVIFAARRSSAGLSIARNQSMVFFAIAGLLFVLLMMGILVFFFLGMSGG